MRQKLNLLTLMVVLALPLALNAQELEVCHSTGDSTAYLPIVGAYTDHGFQTEVVYPSRMLTAMSGGSILSLTFETVEQNVSWAGTTFRMWLEEVADTAFASNYGSAWIGSDLAVLVYEGSMSVVNHRMEVMLDDAFPYNGGHLLVRMACNGGAQWARGYFRCAATGYNSGAYYYTSGGSGWPSPSTALPSEQLLPQCLFGYTDSSVTVCLPPTNLSVDNVSETSATLSWSPRGGESLWAVYLDDSLAAAVTDASYTFTDLSPATAYVAAVRAFCYPSDSSRLAQTDFHTPCVVLSSANLPLVETFDRYNAGSEASIDPCWSKFTQFSSGYPNVSSTAYHGESGKSLRFYSYPSQYNYLVLPAVDDLGGLLLTFWTFNSDPYAAQMQVGTMTDSSQASTFTPLFTTSTGDSASRWVKHEVVVPVGTTGNYLALRNQGAAYKDIFVDDITLSEAPDCMTPTALSLTDIDTVSATLHITDPLDVGSYVVYIRQGISVVDSIGTSDTVVPLASLVPASFYEMDVYSVCGDGERTAPIGTTLKTPCRDNSLPWVDNFDQYSSLHTSYGARMAEPMLPCWDFVSTASGAYMFLTDSIHRYGTSGYSLGFYPFVAGASSVAVLPPAAAPLNTLELTFMTKPEGASSGSIDVGYITDPADMSTFVPVGNFPGSAITGYTQVRATFPGAPDGARAAIRHNANFGWFWYVDEVSLHEAPVCIRPASVSADSVGDSYVELTVHDPAEAGSYSLILLQGGDTVLSTILTDSLFSCDTLHAASAYTAIVATLCADESLTDAVSVSFRTACAEVSSPWMENFDSFSDLFTSNVGRMSEPIFPCWDFVSSSTGAYVFLTDGNYRYGTSGYSMGFNPHVADAQSIAILPRTSESLSGLMLTFRTRPEGDNSGTIDVGYVTDSSDTSTFVSMAHYAPSDFGGAYGLVEVLFPGAPDEARAAIRHNGNLGGWYWFVDEVSFQVAPDCFRPNSLTVDSIGTTQARVLIHDLAAAGSYALVLLAGADTVLSILLSDTAFFVDTLSPNTAYTALVSTRCADGTVTEPIGISFRTACGIVSSLPWNENFVGYSTSIAVPDPLPCWTLIRDNGFPYVVAVGASGSPNSLCFYSNSGSSVATGAILPEFQSGLDSLVLGFSLFAYNIGAGLDVGYVSDRDSLNTFVPVAHVAATSSFSWERHEVSFRGASGHIAFRFTGGANSVMIDDLVVSLRPECASPQTIIVSDVTDSSASFRWDSTASAYEVAYVANGDTTYLSAFVGGTDTTLTDLVPGTAYLLLVRSLCSEINYSEWSEGAFFTDTVVPPQPTVYTLTVTCNLSMGTVTGGGSFIEDTTVTITASGLPGYHFAEWAEDHVADSVRRVTITSDTTFTALFEANPVIGIGDVTLADVALCPNPATSEVTLTGLVGTARVTLIDQSGRAVGEWRVKNGECKLDVSHLPHGAYFVRIAMGDAMAVRRLIIR